MAWYEGGKKRIEGNFINGKKEGLWTTWYPIEAKSSEINFVNGQQISRKQWEKNGSEINDQTP